MYKELSKKEFERKFPDTDTYGLELHNPIYLNNGVILIDTEWNGEHYTLKENGTERRFCPIEQADENSEVLSYNIIGYEGI